MDFNDSEEDMDNFHSTLSIKEQITAIRDNDIFNKLFHELINLKSPLATLLLRHPDDLFLNLDPNNAVIPDEFTTRLPVLYWESFQDIVLDEPHRPSIADYIKKEPSTEEIYEEEDFEEKSFIEENKLDDIIVLLGLKLIQNNSHLRELVLKTEEITLPEVKKAIGQGGIDFSAIENEFSHVIEEIDEGQNIKEISKSILKRSDVDTDTTYAMKKVAKKIVKEMVNDLVIGFSTNAGKFHRGALEFILEKGVPFIRKHNKFTQLSYEYSNVDFQKSLELLWDLHLLLPIVINLRCPNCQDNEGKPLHQILISEKSPKELNDRIPCNWCNNPMIIQAFYSLDYRLIRLIYTNDKLLFYTIAFLLDKYGLDWESNVHSETSEHDFHVKAQDEIHLIECKVFRVSGHIEDDKSLHKKVQKGISQLVNHMDEVKANSAILVCYPCPINKENLDKWIEEALKKVEGAVNRDKIRVIGPNNLSIFLRELI